MGAPWTENDARLAFRRHAKAVGEAVKRAQDMTGDLVVSFVCVLSQESPPEGSRLQVWKQERLPDELRARVEETAPGERANRLPVVLWALDGAMWVMWTRVFVAAPGGTA